MSCLILNVDLPTGITIQKALKDAVALANKVGVKIKLEFNDKTIYVLPYNNIDLLMEAYKEAIKNNSNFVCCFDTIC